MKNLTPNVVGVLAAAAFVVVVHAQQGDQPRRSPHDDPVLTDPNLDRDLAGRRPRRGGDPVAPLAPLPVQQAIPSIKAPPLKAVLDRGGAAPRRTLRRYAEGTFFSAREGEVLRISTGDVVFLPSQVETPGQPESPPEPPMVLMQSGGLTEIERAMAVEGFSGKVRLSGQVFVYRGNVYLLPLAYAEVQPPAPEADTPSTASTEEPGAEVEKAERPTVPTTSIAGNDPRVEDLIKDLETQRSQPRGLTPPPAMEPDQPAPAPAAVDAQPLAEGTTIVMKRARLVRLDAEGGRIALAFDNDLNSPARPPLIVLPCNQLLRLEGLSASRGDSLALKFNGRVFSYRGKGYVLPTFVQALLPGDVVPMQ